VATAKFLVFCVILHDAGEPFPPRRDVAQHLGVSIPLIDTALSQRQGTKHISIRLEFTQGNVRRRVSTVRHRMIEPCEELIRLVHQAEAEDRRDQRAIVCGLIFVPASGIPLCRWGGQTESGSGSACASCVWHAAGHRRSLSIKPCRASGSRPQRLFTRRSSKLPRRPSRGGAAPPDLRRECRARRAQHRFG
jgi:hypothetical protein